MRPEKLLRDLLAQPFGPYLEETVLSDKCKFVQTRRLLLEDFQLAYNNEPTGFDHTEFDGDSIPLSAAHLAPIPTSSRVLFRGVLLVTHLSHFSDKGLRYLNHDLQQRITRSSLNGVHVARAYTTMDIESIFALRAKQKNENVPENERYNIKVLIQGYMHLSASFMRSDLVADGLLFHSANAAKSKFRNYQILSMDIETYQLSRTFLFRHHTLWVMRNILKHAGVPAHKCTPQWFLDQYLLYHAYPGYSRWQRMNFLEGVESSDEGSSNYLEQSSINHPPDAQTHRPRHLRKVHKNEVWSIFVSHSEWILSLVEKHKDLKSKVNTQSWRIFCMQVLQLRERAVLDEDTEGKWGLRDEQGLNQIGKTLFSSPLLVPMTNPLLTPPKNQKSKKGSLPTKPVPPTSHASTASPSKSFLSISQATDQLDNIYDSDFTQGTLSPISHYGGSWFSYSDVVHTPPNPSLYALIPKEMFVAPMLPADLLWHCPVGKGTCSYTIDMCAPLDDNLKLINTVVPRDDIVHLFEKEWKSNDEQVYMIFFEMVDAHWEEHLKELDIKHVQKGNASTFEWIHPQRHKPWPPLRWKFMRARRRQPPKFQAKPESPEF